jgi:Domain of unknown function (DUF4411)
MASPAKGAIYSVDTSSLMDWQARYYPSDVFLGLLTKIDALIAAGRFWAAAVVQEEIGAVGTVGVTKWIQERKSIIVSTAEVLAEC